MSRAVSSQSPYLTLVDCGLLPSVGGASHRLVTIPIAESDEESWTNTWCADWHLGLESRRNHRCQKENRAERRYETVPVVLPSRSAHTGP
jgi:hypothetical protein